MPRLTVLTQYFPPELGAPQARLSELGARLARRGWEVEVLTALPNYPTGRVFEGYPRRKPVVETVAGLRTIRVPLLPAKRGFLRRLLCYFSFVAAAAWWGPKRGARPDAIWVESPPLFLGLAAWYLAWRWRCPFVFNVSDLWPESAVRMGLLGDRSPAVWLAERLELSLYRSAAAVTGQSDGIVDSVQRRSPGAKAVVITNGVDPERFGPSLADDEARRFLGPEPGPLFLYAGLLGHAQGLDQLLDLASALPSEVPGRLVLVGDGPEREALAARIAADGIERVRILPAQPRERIPALLAIADVAIVSLGMRIPGAVPSKIYEAMASAKPILLVAEGEPARKIEEGPCGLVVAPGDREGLRDAFERLASDAVLRRRLGEAGRRLAETRYHRDRAADVLDALLREAAA